MNLPSCLWWGSGGRSARLQHHWIIHLILHVQVPSGLRERESQPYHIQPAVPERLSVGQRPGAQLRQPPQSACPVGAAQPSYSYKARSTGRKHGVLAEELATQKLQEAQRLRDW